MDVLQERRVTGVVSEKELRREARDGLPVHAPGAGEPGGGIKRIASVPSRADLFAVTVFVDENRMEVDSPSACILKHKPGGPGVFKHGETKGRETADQALYVLQFYDGIKVRMLPGLPPKKRVNTPATVKPDTQPRLLQPVNHGEDVSSGHGRAGG